MSRSVVVEMSMVLALDRVLEMEGLFRNGIQRDVASALQLSTNRIEVLGFRSGSVIVTIRIYDDVYERHNATYHAWELQQQATNARSILKQGGFTYAVQSVSVVNAPVQGSPGTAPKTAGKSQYFFALAVGGLTLITAFVAFVLYRRSKLKKREIEMQQRRKDDAMMSQNLLGVV